MASSALPDPSSWLVFAAGLGVAATLGYGIALWQVLRDETRGRRSLLPAPRTLRGRLLAGLVLLALVPAIGLAISLGQRQLAQHRAESLALIASTSGTVSREVDAYMEQALAAVRSAAAGLALVPAYDKATLAPLLLGYHALEPNYLTMLVTDDYGVIMAASRRTANGMEATTSSDRSVADRTYFIEPMRSGEPYVSDVFRGRGLGSDPIVAVSAPIVRGGRRVGVVEGSLDLRRFSQLENRYAFQSAGARLLLVDEHRRVIYASPGTGLTFLQDLGAERLLIAAADARQGAVFEATGVATGDSSGKWHVAWAPTRLGWKALVLTPTDSLAGRLSRDAGVVLLWLLVVLACALPLAIALHRQVTAPLSLLEDELAHFRLESGGHDFMSGSAHVREYRGLFHTMHRFSWRLRASYRRLEQSLADTRALRDELSAVLARREEEVRERTRELDAANRELQRLARVDPLTGLANRRWFNEFLQQAWRVARRESSPLACLLVDVDHFKQYNDTYGHQAGDECLKRVAGIVRGTAGRALDHAARYGGEEFVVLLSDAPLDATVVIADRLRKAVAALSLPHAGSPLGHVTVSIGVRNLVPAEAATPEQLLADADLALYEAKRGGRNRVAVHDGRAIRIMDPSGGAATNAA
jgi:diguanylate cyclase (GGDEF)-like protein